MRLQTFFPLLAATLVLALPFGASAQIAGGRALAAIDTDGDGAISRDEMSRTLSARFARLDANGDGVLTEAEFSATAMQVFAAIDSDASGTVTRSEIRSKADAARSLVGLAQ